MANKNNNETEYEKIRKSIDEIKSHLKLVDEERANFDENKKRGEAFHEDFLNDITNPIIKTRVENYYSEIKLNNKKIQRGFDDLKSNLLNEYRKLSEKEYELQKESQNGKPVR